MYQKIYIPESEKVEKMSVSELHVMQSYYYHNFPQTLEQIMEQRCISERLRHIQDLSHT